MVHDLRDLKDRKEQLEDELKSVNGQIRALAEGKIPEYMQDNEIEKFSVTGVGTVYVQQKVYANVKADNREAFFHWLRENGSADLIKETVHPSTLNAFAKEQLSEGKEIPDVLEARLYPTATLRRK
jgi:hypothetical protein